MMERPALHACDGCHRRVVGACKACVHMPRFGENLDTRRRACVAAGCVSMQPVDAAPAPRALPAEPAPPAAGA